MTQIKEEIPAIKKISWKEKVMGLMNLSEEGQVGLFGDLARKRYNKAIKERKLLITRKTDAYNDEKERDEEILAELKTDLNHASITVDSKSLQSLAAREEYFYVFDKKLSTAMALIESKIRNIKTKEDNFKEDIDKINGEISIFENKLLLLD